MAEQVNLTVPAAGVAATPRWLIYGIFKERGVTSNGATVSYDPSTSYIKVLLVGEQGHRKSHIWKGAAADADILALNKANNTTLSEHKRIYNKLIADGVIAGTVSGTPD